MWDASSVDASCVAVPLDDPQGLSDGTYSVQAFAGPNLDAVGDPIKVVVGGSSAPGTTTTGPDTTTTPGTTTTAPDTTGTAAGAVSPQDAQVVSRHFYGTKDSNLMAYDWTPQGGKLRTISGG
jgi:hypothetical protein